MIVQILSIIFFSSIWVLGITIVTQEDMLLYFLRKRAMFYAQKEGTSFFDALILCEWCMPSIHSIIGYLFCIVAGIINHNDGLIWLFYPIVVAGTSLVCGLIWAAYSTLVSYKKYIDNKEQLTFFDILDRKGDHQQRQKKFQNKKPMNHER